MGTSGTWYGAVGSALRDVTTVEGKVAVTVVLVGAAGVVGWLLVPRLARTVDLELADRFDDGAAGTAVSFLATYVPVTPGDLLVGTVQASLLFGAGMGVLVVWRATGLLDATTRLVTDNVSREAVALAAGRAAVSVVLLVLSYVGAAALSDTVGDFSRQTEWMTEHQEEIVLRVSQLSLFVVMGLVLMGVWGIDLGGLLVGAGFLGIVLGFAARQTLGSLIAGFVLMFSRPFTIGDWVQVGDQEGIVTDITIFNTRLENFDGEFVIIPNDRVSDRAVVNRSQKGLLRLRIDVGVDYETDPDHARTVALEAIGECEEVVDAPPPQVFPKSFGDSAVIMEMRFWIDHPTPPRKWKAVSAVIAAVKRAFRDEGITVPFPQRELSGRSENGGFRVHDVAEEAADAAADQSGPR